jgi:hypothetical protein
MTTFVTCLECGKRWKCWKYIINAYYIIIVKHGIGIRQFFYYIQKLLQM